MKWHVLLQLCTILNFIITGQDDTKKISSKQAITSTKESSSGTKVLSFNVRKLKEQKWTPLCDAILQRISDVVNLSINTEAPDGPTVVFIKETSRIKSDIQRDLTSAELTGK